MSRNKLAWIYGLLLIMIATAFWTQSRVPALNDKAGTGDRINISAIAFDTVRVVDDSEPLLERIFWSSINWGYTNLKGMAFGFILGATLLSLIQSVPRSLSSRSDYLNSVYGMAIGAPLGVCVNCATPIAQGMVEANTRLTTALSALFSSPTLNPIVLIMAFALLPFHLAMTKVVATLTFILLVVPSLLGLLNRRGIGIEPGASARNSLPELVRSDFGAGPACAVPGATDLWRDALRVAFSSVGKNLWLILRITFPLMVVAGILGSALIESLPENSLANLSMSPGTVLVAAAIGTFLPVPIAFDVLAVNALISAGIPVGIGAALLFSLGIFSIYPALVIARRISARLSAALFVAVVALAVLVAYVAQGIDDSVTSSALLALESELDGNGKQIVLESAAEACSGLDEGATAQCLEHFFKADAFRQSPKTVCGVNAGGAAEPGLSPVARACRDVSNFRDVEAQAIAANDVSICRQAVSLRFSEECMISVIAQNALADSAIGQCALIETEWNRQSCRRAVINQRLLMKSAQACNIGLTGQEQAFCVNHLNAYIASEFDDLDTCGFLSAPAAVSECQRRVVMDRVINWQDYRICSEVSNTALAAECDAAVIAQRATRSGSPAGCEALAGAHLRSGCRINAAISRIERQRLWSGIPDRGEAEAKSIEAGRTLQSTEGCPGQECESPAIAWRTVADIDNIHITVSDLHPTGKPKSAVFEQFPGEQLGLVGAWQFEASDFSEPFVYGKGIASGDFNNDGWPDVAMASEHGALLYVNGRDGSFEKVADLRPGGLSKNAFLVAFADLDNDGWQDVFMSAYGGENFVFANRQGSFDPADVESLPATDSIVALAAGFADWDRDGDLDIAIGNWSYGAEGAFIPEKSHNVLYENQSTGFALQIANETPGETLSVLFSDMNNDGYADMVVGNDRKEPDAYYEGAAAGFGRVSSGMGLIPVTSFNTMSYESADFDNDLLPDLFSTDMSFAPAPRRDYCAAVDSLSRDR
ncbi:MAG: FG-GAP-like repeat-containing protein, partial [Gammaproteobacteria bacterium]|nr:FG-GAP-like repeat-containing protein [Gammaproteobacteria bacterium]